jgi:hypothetical protein
MDGSGSCGMESVMHASPHLPNPSILENLQLTIPLRLSKFTPDVPRIRHPVRSAADLRHLYRVTDPRYADHYAHSEARLRAEFVVQSLQEDCGVHHHMERLRQVELAPSTRRPSEWRK